MVSASKILTVSYGTFSCTLEGFDDSFDTMKAIAEYFRDLAADDRYFGAEPPTPDAEMLARIAEREISRRVDAREDQGQIVLRATEDHQLAPTKPEAEDAPTESTQPTEPTQQKSEEPDLSGIVAKAADIAAEEVNEETSEVTEEVKELRTEEVQVEEEPEIPEIGEEPAETVEEIEDAQPEEPLEAPVAEPVETFEDPTSEFDADIAAVVEAEIEPATQEEPASEAEVEDIPAAEEDTEIVDELALQEAMGSASDESEEIVEETAQDDSVVDRLQRISSVVASTDQTYEDEQYTEDEHAQDFLNTTASELDAVLAEDDTAEVVTEETDTTEADTIDSIMSQIAETEIEEPAEAAETASDLSVEDEPDLEEFTALADEEEVDDLSQLLADAEPDEEPVAVAEPEEALATEAETEEWPEAEETEAEPLILDSDSAVETDEFEDLEAEDQQRPLNARVVKMKRSEFEEAVSEGHFEEEVEDEFDDIAGGAESTLSPEDEADLQRELAEVEAELSSEAPEHVEDEDEYEINDLDAAETEEPDEKPRESRLPTAEEGSDVSLIFDKAASHLEEPESSKRRNAIQHLRAAVAATRAEKRAGNDVSQHTDDSPYRSDLASVVKPTSRELTSRELTETEIEQVNEHLDQSGVVRPRRPAASAPTSARRPTRPYEVRPAPLKLVAEQRIDTEREPIRPRRVSSAQMAAESAQVDTGEGFSDFAESIGAATLPELLEAAAAYMSDIEGREQFSRPMLMGKLKEVTSDDYSREDGLRSFGQLLREGKLQKLKGGRFSVTEQTEYRAAARDVG